MIVLSSFRSSKYVQTEAQFYDTTIYRNRCRILARAYEMFGRERLVDLYRAGIGLMEIVTEPDIR